MKTKSKIVLLLIVISVAIFFLVSLSAAINHSIKFLLALGLYSVFTYLCFLKTRKYDIKHVIILSIIILPQMMLMFIHIINWDKTLLSLPSSLAGFLGVFVGYQMIRVTRKLKIVILTLSVTLAIWVYTSGYDVWLDYLNYNRYKRNYSTMPSLSIITDRADTLQKFPHAEKVVVLDIWTQHCGHCFNQMPEFENIRQRFNQVDDVYFFSVNMLVRKDIPGNGRLLYDDYKFDMPLLFIPKSSGDLLGVNVVPVYIIIKNNEVVYFGGIRNLEKKLKRIMGT